MIEAQDNTEISFLHRKEKVVGEEENFN